MTNAESLRKATEIRLSVPRPKNHTQLSQALTVQRIIFEACCKRKTDLALLASLARSWVLVTDCVREIRGIPKAGQLRPDLDPAQAMKALKRIRERLPVDIAGHKSALADEPTPASAPPAARRAPGKQPHAKDATSSLTEQPPNPLNKPPIEERLMNESALDLPDEETPND